MSYVRFTGRSNDHNRDGQHFLLRYVLRLETPGNQSHRAALEWNGAGEAVWSREEMPAGGDDVAGSHGSRPSWLMGSFCLLTPSGSGADAAPAMMPTGGADFLIMLAAAVPGRSSRRRS